MKAAKTSIFVIGCVATKIIDETKHQPAMLGVGVLKRRESTFAQTDLVP